MCQTRVILQRLFFIAKQIYLLQAVNKHKLLSMGTRKFTVLTSKQELLVKALTVTHTGQGGAPTHLPSLAYLTNK